MPNLEKLIFSCCIGGREALSSMGILTKSIDGQLSFFDKADTLRDESAGEPEEDQVIPPMPRKKKTKGQREIDLKAFPEEVIPAHTVSEETLDG